MKRSSVFICVYLWLIVFLTGCAHAPVYQRPTVDLPPAYRGQPADTPSLADQKWPQIYPDEALQELIRKALTDNYDVRIAATHVLEAEAQVGIVRADQFPTLTGGLGGQAQRAAKAGAFPAYAYAAGVLQFAGTWNIDFWRRYRNATDAARAELLATDWARQQVTTTLVADIATGYFSLRELDWEREIAAKALDSRTESLDLTKVQEEHGLVTLLDVRQAEQLVETAAAQLPDLDRRIEQQENALSTLAGSNPGPIRRGTRLEAQARLPEVPAGIPSALLERRPDIRQVEEQLVAANAQVAIARAAFYPQISLTGSGGLQSSALNAILSSQAIITTLTAQALQPIFNAGKLRAGVRLAEAQQQELVLTYRKTILTALQSVSDSLAAYRRTREFRLAEEKLAESARDAARLSNLRYNAGETNYLEVLTNETNSLTADLGVAQARRNELLSLVQLYQALGGGWEK